MLKLKSNSIDVSREPTESKQVGEVRYVKISLFSVMAALPFIVWGALFNSSAQFVNITPMSNSYKPTSNPLIGAAWTKLPFIKAQKARLTVDGKEVKNVVLTPRGFRYQPGKLRDGIHTAKAAVHYRFPFPRVVLLSWKFNVDTKPPDLNLNFLSGSAVKGNTVAVPSAYFSISGKTEHHADVYFKASPTMKLISTNKNGKFGTKLPVKNGNMDLKIVSKDLAGNLTIKKYKVIEDNESPQILSVLPKVGGTFRGFPTALSVKSQENESWISKAQVKMENGQVFDLSSNDSKNYSSHVGLSDGFHKGEIRLTDAVGRYTVLPFSLNVDTLKILVNRAQRMLYVYRGGKVIKTFRVAVGMPRFPTPRGNFKIVNKRINPTWVNPGSGWAKTMPNRIPPGPDNPLGTRAMDLNVSGIRIHGTPSAGSIGTAASHGCIRMRIPEAVQLFKIVKIGTPVEIQ